MFAVVVTLMLKPGHMDAFLPAMQDNATSARRDEPGCLRFDVCTDPQRRDEVFLYELYEDAAAFDAHLAAPHFKAFDVLSAPMIASKDVRTFAQVEA